jgi:hypothetical protein
MFFDLRLQPFAGRKKPIAAHARHSTNPKFQPPIFSVADEVRVHQRKPCDSSDFRFKRSKKASHSVKGEHPQANPFRRR